MYVCHSGVSCGRIFCLSFTFRNGALIRGTCGEELPENLTSLCHNQVAGSIRSEFLIPSVRDGSATLDFPVPFPPFVVNLSRLLHFLWSAGLLAYPSSLAWPFQCVFLVL